MEDGRLRPGDRLLAVDGVELTGKSQSEAVALLRNVPAGGKVMIVVSRQDDTTSPKNPVIFYLNRFHFLCIRIISWIIKIN